MRLSCMRVARLLSASAAGLSPAEALRLEEHLDGCPACRNDAAALERMRRLAEPDRMLPDRARGRAIDAALRRAGEQRGRAPAMGRRHIPILLGAAAAAAAVSLLLFRGEWGDPAKKLEPQGREGTSVPPQAAAAALLDSPVVVIAGAVESDGKEIAAGGEVRAGVPMAAVGAVTLRVAHARIDLATTAEVEWRPELATLRLDRGRLLAEVDPAAQRAFRVATSRFTVEVTGTRFVVDTSGVRVIEGRVRVVAPDGRVLAAQVEAGGRWELATESASAEPHPARRDSDRARSGRQPADERAAAPVDVAALLDSATRHLAADEVAAARRDLDQVLAARPGRASRAEAEVLLAQAMLMDGDVSGAVGNYLAAADRYGDLPAGERARFQAAKAEANFGAPARARVLLQGYLRQYPDGRFRAEAERRLQRLE